jgi:hypothetical protein
MILPTVDTIRQELLRQTLKHCYPQFKADRKFNPRCSYARITVVVQSVCSSVNVYVCVFLIFYNHKCNTEQIIKVLGSEVRVSFACHDWLQWSCSNLCPLFFRRKRVFYEILIGKMASKPFQSTKQLLGH